MRLFADRQFVRWPITLSSSSLSFLVPPSAGNLRDIIPTNMLQAEENPATLGRLTFPTLKRSEQKWPALLEPGSTAATTKETYHGHITRGEKICFQP